MVPVRDEDLTGYSAEQAVPMFAEKQGKPPDSLLITGKVLAVKQ
jgi:hypothetical protein